MNEEQVLKIDKVLLKNAIRLSIGGFINDGGDVFDIPDLLQEIKNEYEQAIKIINSKLNETTS